MAASRIPRVDPNQFKPKGGGELDNVLEPSRLSSAEKQGNSLKKIATFKPVNLKSLSSGIQKSSAVRKQAAALRTAANNLVVNKVQTIREQNPFTNIVEKQAGKRLNISA